MSRVRKKTTRSIDSQERAKAMDITGRTAFLFLASAGLPASA